MTDIYNLIQQYKKIHGQAPDVLLLDYLELVDPGDGKFYSVGEEKHRRQAIARRFKNLTVSEKNPKASNISEELVNSSEFCLSRNHISGDKNLIDSFSLFFSINQTVTEYNNDLIRIYIDKSRSSSRQNKQLIRICTDFQGGRFYSRSRTLNEFATHLI